jgi:hypothetical protein
MGMTKTVWISTCALAVSSALIAESAIAQDTGEVIVIYTESIPEVVNRTYFQNDPDFYVNRGAAEQIDSILGIGLVGTGFIENEIAEDGRALTRLMDDLMMQQALDSPPIRTADLNNPYSTSLLLEPEVPIEQYAPAPPYNPTPFIRNTPSAPVPGLW